MTCAACVRRVEKVLQRAPGVQGATVNLAKLFTAERILCLGFGSILTRASTP